MSTSENCGLIKISTLALTISWGAAFLWAAGVYWAVNIIAVGAITFSVFSFADYLTGFGDGH